MFPFCGSLCLLPFYHTSLSFLPYLLNYQISHKIPFHSLRKADLRLLSDTLSFLGSLFFTKHVKLSPRHYCFVPESTHNCKLPFHQIQPCSDSCSFPYWLEIEKGIKCLLLFSPVLIPEFHSEVRSSELKISILIILASAAWAASSRSVTRAMGLCLLLRDRLWPDVTGALHRQDLPVLLLLLHSSPLKAS